MASIEKRINANNETSYRVKVRLKGFPPQTTTFRRLTDARKWVQQTEAAIREGRHFKKSEARKHNLTEAINRYIDDVLPTKPKSAKDQKTQLLWWKNNIGDYALSDVTSALIAHYRDKLAKEEISKGKKRSPSTINRYLAVLSHLFTIAIKEWAWVEENPLRKVSKMKEPRGRVRFLSDDEREKLLQAAKESSNPYLYLIIVLCLSTGARKMEILSLCWSNVDFSRNVIVLHDTKNKERRVLPMAGLALELMKQHAKVRRLDSQYVFPSHDGKKPINIGTSWKRLQKQTGIEDFRFHDLRHSAASYLAMNGASLAEIAEVLGHKTLQMVKRYAHLSEAHTAKIVGRMNKKIFG